MLRIDQKLQILKRTEHQTSGIALDDDECDLEALAVEMAESDDVSACTQ